ncbi:hypothetical protein SDJN02_13801, partial [Cucurbita argyrosperma subsp. argyrosperma]
MKSYNNIVICITFRELLTVFMMLVGSVSKYSSSFLVIHITVFMMLVRSVQNLMSWLLVLCHVYMEISRN